MKRKAEYTDAEKIKMFDELYDGCREEINESRAEEHDDHYFWEWVMDKILGLTRGDWDRHNDGKSL